MHENGLRLDDATARAAAAPVKTMASCIWSSGKQLPPWQGCGWSVTGSGTSRR
jgi:hypothetical protein